MKFLVDQHNRRTAELEVHEPSLTEQDVAIRALVLTTGICAYDSAASLATAELASKILHVQPVEQTSEQDMSPNSSPNAQAPLPVRLQLPVRAAGMLFVALNNYVEATPRAVANSFPQEELHGPAMRRLRGELADTMRGTLQAEYEFGRLPQPPAFGFARLLESHHQAPGLRRKGRLIDLPPGLFAR